MRIAWFLFLSHSIKEVFVSVNERGKHPNQAFSFLNLHFPICEAQKLHEQFRKYALQELMAQCDPAVPMPSRLIAWSFSSTQ
jgi:hypothetical protein